MLSGPKVIKLFPCSTQLNEILNAHKYKNIKTFSFLLGPDKPIMLFSCSFMLKCQQLLPGRVAQSVGHPTHKSGVLGSIPGLATYFRFSFRFFKKGSCQLLAKVCARSTG